MGELFTESVHVAEVARNVANEKFVILTTIDRRKKIGIISVSIGSEFRLSCWKDQQYPIPEGLVGATFCLGRTWTFEVRQGQDHPAEFRFTDPATGRYGEWKKNPTAAFRSTYKRITGEFPSRSFNGRAEVGVFSDSIRALLVTLDIERLRNIGSPLVQYSDTMVTIHPEHSYQDLSEHSLVAGDQQGAPTAQPHVAPAVAQEVAQAVGFPDQDEDHLEDSNDESSCRKRYKPSEDDSEEKSTVVESIPDESDGYWSTFDDLMECDMTIQRLFSKWEADSTSQTSGMESTV